MSDVTGKLEWKGGQAFAARVGDNELTIDGETRDGASPMQHVALGIASCMGIDVAHILGRMRTPASSMAVTVHGSRADEEPRRFTRIELDFQIEGEVPEANLERAVRLSRERYCSAWASIRTDTELEIRTTVSPPPPA